MIIIVIKIMPENKNMRPIVMSVLQVDIVKSYFRGFHCWCSG